MEKEWSEMCLRIFATLRETSFLNACVSKMGSRKDAKIRSEHQTSFSGGPAYSAMPEDRRRSPN